MFATISISIADADGDIFPVSVHVSIPDATTLADAISLYVDPFYFTGLGMLTLGAPVSVKLIVEPDLQPYADFGGTPPANSDVEEKARFVFRTATGFDVSMKIPAIWEDYFSNSGAGKEIDITNAAVITFIALMTEDIANGGIDAVDSHGHDLSRFVSAKQWFGKG